MVPTLSKDRSARLLAPGLARVACRPCAVRLALQRERFGKLVAGGWAIPHWPQDWPGGERSLAEQKVICEELARADTPQLILTFGSTYHAACTLLE